MRNGLFSASEDAINLAKSKTDAYFIWEVKAVFETMLNEGHSSVKQLWRSFIHSKKRSLFTLNSALYVSMGMRCVFLSLDAAVSIKGQLCRLSSTTATIETEHKERRHLQEVTL
ncbi:hypothetical protein CEXT_490891 [Caerostris extrusa]|uniref:Uncharacterized protein n=1 Tax=Caerostris extrusa TaxID=172846 RepID=A0AAV4XL51_CAEEX|nr:hypothetical protein CEXT_490891 [Caerostris extrusa]